MRVGTEAGQTGKTVNLLAIAFSGSNPLLPRLNNICYDSYGSQSTT